MQYGIFATVLSVSMILSPITLGGIAKKTKIGRLTIYVSTSVAALTVILSLISTDIFINLFGSNFVPFTVITLTAFLIGLVVTQANIAVGTLFCSIVPKEFMGRTASVMNLGLNMAVPVGQVLIGITLDIMPASSSVLIVSMIMLLTALYFKKPFFEADNVGELVDSLPSDESFVSK